MSASVATKLFRSRHLHAGLLGLLLAAAFPKPGLALLAWIVPGLWLVCARGLARKGAFAVGFTGGLMFNLAALHWLNNIPYPVMPTIGWIALSAYLALYPATWLMLCSDGFQHLPNATGMEPSWTGRALWCLASAALWVALEMLMSRLLTGFPWLLLGNSQYQILPLVQLASITGVHGLSFLIVWISLSTLCGVIAILGHPAKPSLALREIALPMLALAIVLAFGMTRLLKPAPVTREVSLALIQPSIPQTVKWDADASKLAFEKVLRLSKAALLLKPDVLIWPEAATPGFLRYDDDLYKTVTSLASEHRVWLILGSDDQEPSEADPSRASVFNSAFLVSPRGELVAKYDKQRLVIFGEYVPLANWLPFVKWLTPVEGSFTPGKKPVQFELKQPDLTIAPLICFEDVFGFHLRHYVTPETDFLLNLTNDGWFGESSQQWQHATMAVFRAVETGRPMVRCTNNGLTCWVDPLGRMHDVHFDDSKNIYGAGFKITRLPVTVQGEGRTETLFLRWGDWFGWSCVVISAIATGLALTKRRS